MFTFWRSLTETRGRRVNASYSRLFYRFNTPIVAASKVDLPGWSPTIFRDDRRRLANVIESYAVGLDRDTGTLAIETDLWCCMHTTYSHTAEAPRSRVIFPTSRPITAAEYYRVHRWLSAHVPDVDSPVKDPSRFWYVPGVAPGGEYVCREYGGSTLDVDRALAETPDRPIAPVVPFVPRTDVTDRARAYLRTVPPAVSGQHGGTHTFLTAKRLVLGFGLSEDDAYGLLTEWNATCVPPWSEYELRRKVRQAMQARTSDAGWLTREGRHG